MHNNIKAIFFDIDGTLVSFQTHCIPPSAVETLHKLRQAGVKLFIASGRHISSINNLGNEHFDGYVTINGGMTIVDGKIIDKNPIPKADVRRMADYIANVRPFPCIFVQENELVMNFGNDTTREVFGILNFPTPPLGYLNDLADNDIFQMISFFDEAEGKEIMPMLPGCTEARWHPQFADVVPSGISKVEGIKKIAGHFGFSTDEIMAFGDGGNDVQMLQYVGLGIAMGNAEDHVKQAADDVTTDIDHDGIKNAIAKHLAI